MKTKPLKLQVEFGMPQYKWLPVELTIGDFHLKFQASGVLNDPLADLISCLLLVMQGVDASVSWWLEPAELAFQFNIQPQGIQLKISELDDWHSISPQFKQQLFCLEASQQIVLLPFWRALQKLNPADFNRKNWFPLPIKKLEKLTNLIKARKQLG
ncbi:hypothetical protein [Hymenobacter sp. BRD67]|uniref:hypothetical protein n=1 Tax=Hymenobacter sp. BRD67 TaxID=2675877 RepID=UPI001564437D|nr:hypothetical protein [Hymenobacter sp. BRD67]QKG52700.1 hypothetical protein GKZ67_08925 [Hymenobacter sp. BRD67]